MKKLTLCILIFFAGIVITIFAMGLMFPDAHAGVTQNSQAAAGKMIETKIFSPDEVSRHKTKNDCYLIVNDQVYDVSSYIDQHPGGVRKIVDYCGKESSVAFAAVHSNFAWNLLEDYYVGDIQ